MATDPTSLPSLQDLQKTKKYMDDIDDFVRSSDETLVDTDNRTRRTLTGIENDANSAISDFNNNGDVAINQFQTSADIAIDALESSRGYNDVGTFAAGFTYENFNDIGRDDNGNPWVYLGDLSGSNTHVVAPGTVPSAFPLLYEQRSYSDHEELANRNKPNAHLSESITNDDGLTSQDTHDALKATLKAQGLSGNFGLFAKGFAYNIVGDVGITANGEIYTYAGSDLLPVSVAPGTNPVGDADYEIYTNKKNEIHFYGDELLDQYQRLTDSISAANTKNEKLFIHGRCRTTDTVSFKFDDLQVEFVDNAAIVPDSNVLIGLKIGDVVNQPSRMDIKRPTVDRGTYSGATENIGIQFEEMNQCSIHDYESRFSKYPVKFYASADSGGIAHNNIYNPQNIGGKVNLWLTATGNGFCNENKFFGGRCFDDGEMETQLLIEAGTAVNNNQFYGINLEGNGAQAIYCDGQQNLFISPRTEGSWSADDIVFGPNARFNRVESQRLDLSVNDSEAPDDTNTWVTRGSGLKSETGDNNIRHSRQVHSGAHSTPAGDAVAISGATNTDPVVITATSHGLSTGQYITIRKVAGMTQLNGQVFRVGSTTSNTMELLNPKTGVSIDGAEYGSYTSGGYLMAGVPMNSVEDINASSAGSHVYDIFHGEDNASSYVFRSIRDSDGLVRSSLTTDGRLSVAREVNVAQSGYTFKPFKLGSYSFWIGNNQMLKKSGSPASESDGTSVGLGNSQTTVGAAGAADALPATPSGYVDVTIGGNDFVIPYYAKV